MLMQTETEVFCYQANEVLYNLSNAFGDIIFHYCKNISPCIKVI